MNRFARGLAGVLCALAFCGHAAAAAPDSDDRKALEAFVDGAVLSLMKTHNSPSGTVAIARGGEFVFVKGYGFQDVAKQVPVDPWRTLFRPGSVSKLLTWVAVMQLVEQGKLDLDADVNQYLVDFKIRDAFDAPITLQHVMTHTTGFEDGALGYLIIDDPAKALPLAEAMERYQPERVNPPGTHTAYSNYATALAGLIVQIVSGVPFNDYIQQNILDPLGMQNSSFVEPLPGHLAKNMAVSYSTEAGTFVEKPFEIITSFGPAGALSATSTDMLRFAEAIRNGGELSGRRILKRETVEQMLTRQFTHDDRLSGMALGFYEDDYEGTRVVGHGGDTQYFHSFLGIDHDHEMTFFVSFGGAGGSTVRSSLLPAFYREYFPRAESAPVGPDDFAERAGQYAGNYGFWRNNFSTIEKALGLSASVQVLPAGNNRLMITLGGKAKQYAEVEPDLFRETDPGIAIISGIAPRLLAFQRNEAGEVNGFVMEGLPFMSLRKLPMVATPNFNLTLLAIALVVFLGMLLRRFFQRAAIRSLPAADRSAIGAGVLAALANWAVVIVGVVVFSIVQDRIFSEIPLLFKLWLVFPILAVLAGLYLLYRTFGVWKARLLGGGWARLRYTVVTLSALFMCWFYWYWNILGFQYR